MKITKDDRRTRYTKMVLKDSLMALMREKNIGRISVKELCEKADINRSTFYSHYTDPYDLLTQIEHEVITEIYSTLGDFDFKGLSTETLLVMEKIFEYIGENASLCKTLLSENGNPLFQKILFSEIKEQCLREWTAEGPIRYETAEYIYEFIITGCVGLVLKWLDDEPEKPASDIAAMVTKMTTAVILSFRNV